LIAHPIKHTDAIQEFLSRKLPLLHKHVFIPDPLFTSGKQHSWNAFDYQVQ